MGRFWKVVTAEAPNALPDATVVPPRVTEYDPTPLLQHMPSPPESAMANSRVWPGTPQYLCEGSKGCHRRAKPHSWATPAGDNRQPASQRAYVCVRSYPGTEVLSPVVAEVVMTVRGFRAESVHDTWPGLRSGST